ncbi:MAG TPA: hypothetical protein VN830_09090 [Verrucomicrobiae bacterium]|nr:hypothetical protein [Verrucomicrobiae bacterium]
MKRAAIALTVGLMGSLLCNAGAHGQTKNQKKQMPVYEDRDGYEVLSVLLNRLSVVQKNETVRIDPRTASPGNVAEIKEKCSGIPPEFRSAWEDFDKKVQTRSVLRRDFTLAKNYELVYPSAVAVPDHRETREEGYKRIRSGTYYVAPVGFDDKRTRAVAFVEYICGNPCGESLFYYLRKTEKGWEEASEVPPKVQSCGEIY